MKPNPKPAKKIQPFSSPPSEPQVAIPTFDNSTALPPAKGIYRFSLLLLIAAVVLINLPFISRHYMLGHDSKALLGVLDYFYSNRLFSGELPHWMAYGVYGLDATPFHLSFMTAASYLTIFAGKFIGITDSLGLLAITLCIEQLFFLLGMYLLARRLFREHLTVFCVCLTAVGTVAWQIQISLNFHVYYLLPLAFYFILRVRQDGTGYCGWLAGIVAILGPMGGAAYFYPLWALILTVFSAGVFWGNFRCLRSLFRLKLANTIAGLAFMVLAIAFVGLLWHALDNFAVVSPGRDASGKVTLANFLTYGGNNLTAMLVSLLQPAAFLDDLLGRDGMADYLGLFTFFCLPIIWRRRHNHSLALPFGITAATIAGLSLGGLFACLVYYFPGMHMYRHIGFLTGALKVPVFFLAGFGLDAVIQSLRDRTFISRPTYQTLGLIFFALIFYIDLNIGGPIWATVCNAAQHTNNELFYILTATSAIYPLARAVLMLAFAVAAWRWCRANNTTHTNSPTAAIALLAVCVMGDCALFQLELCAHLRKGMTPIDFPASKLVWPITRSEQLPASALAKYQIWTNGPGDEYQVTRSCAFQWDPPAPRFRADWLAKNVVEMRKVLESSAPQELPLVFGINSPKFRLVQEAVWANTDEEALLRLGSETGWDKRVILTGANKDTPTATSSSFNISSSKIDLGEFSANHFTLSVSNNLPQPVWLVYAEAYTPGWKAAVNGKPASVEKAYTAFKAIEIQPGNNVVKLFYQNGIRSMCLNIFSIMAGCAAAIGLGWLLWIANRDARTKK